MQKLLENELLKYSSPYPSEITYTSDKNFMVRLKAMIDRRAHELGFNTNQDIIEYLTKDAEEYLFDQKTTIQ